VVIASSDKRFTLLTLLPGVAGACRRSSRCPERLYVRLSADLHNRSRERTGARDSGACGADDFAIEDVSPCRTRGKSFS
jgi:hypothetical protein